MQTGKNISELTRINTLDESGLFAYYYNGQTYRVSFTQVLNAVANQLNLAALDDVGTVFISERKDVPTGCLNYCNGQEYTNIDVQYPDFYAALLNDKIHYVSYSEYDTIINNSKNNGPSVNGWCPFLAFDRQLKKMKMPQLNDELIAFYFGNSRQAVYDSLPDLTGSVELQGVYGIYNTNDGLFGDSGSTTPFSGGQTGSTNSHTLNFRASRSNMGTGNPFGRSSHVRTKGKASIAYIVVSNTRHLSTSNVVTKVDLYNEEQARIQGDTDLSNEITRLDAKIEGATQVYYKPTYSELRAFATENQAVLKTGTLLICGGLDTGEPTREFFWDSDTKTMIEKTVSINLDGYYNKIETDNLLLNKVDKRQGYDLSENNFTTEEKLKLQDVVTQQEVTTLRTELENAINNKIDKTQITSNISMTNPSNDKIVTEEGIAASIASQISIKMDRDFSFTKSTNLRDLIVGQDISGLYLDLSTWLSGNLSIPTKDFTITFQSVSTQKDGANVYVDQSLFFDHTNNNLYYRYTVTGELLVQKILIRNGFIATTEIVANNYWKIDPHLDWFTNNSLIVQSITPRLYDFVLTETTHVPTPDDKQMSYNYLSEFENYFDVIPDTQKISVFDNAYLTIANDSVNYNFVNTSVTTVTATFQTLDDFVSMWNNLTIQEKVAFNGIVIEIIRYPLEEPLVNRTVVTTGDVAYTFTDTTEYDAWVAALPDKTVVDGIIVEIAGILYQLSVTLYQDRIYEVQTNSVSKIYLVTVERNDKPTCDIGIYRETSISDIMNIVNSLETGITLGNTVEMKARTTDISKIDSVVIINGGSRYNVGDRIKIYFSDSTHTSGKDRPGYLIVNSINTSNNNSVTSLNIAEEGLYLQNLTEEVCTTTNVDNSSAGGLTVRLIFKQEQPITLDSYIPLKENTLATVLIDETHNYLGTQWVYKQEEDNPDPTVKRWYFYKISDSSDIDKDASITLTTNISATSKNTEAPTAFATYEKIKQLTFNFTNQQVWNISHLMNKYPSIKCIDENGNEFYGTIAYPTINNATVSFNEPVSGTAIVN